MTFRDDLIKDHLDHLSKEKQPEPPQKHALVLHMNPDAFDLLLYEIVEHVLTGHLNVSTSVSDDAIRIAALSGKSVIMPVTKDVGESLVAKAYACPIMQMASDFKISLEVV